jgi:hypothetical protein
VPLFRVLKLSTEQDQAKLIAERVARRITEHRGGSASSSNSAPRPGNGAPVREEISAIRDGLHDLESKLDRIESKLAPGAHQSFDVPSIPRARVIDFVSSGPPVRTQPQIQNEPAFSAKEAPALSTTSPWLGRMPTMMGDESPQIASHPSQERFGVEEAAVTELVEFFENEKKCTVEPGGKPCDHCAMCSSRGF